MLDITEREYIQLTGFIKTNYGINLGEGKKALLLSRLQKVLAEQQFESFTEYYGFLRRDATGKALSTLVDKVTTNHTYFMREPAHFSYLKDKLLPYFADTVKNRDLCTWSAGCSSGEEPYTLAMLMDDFFGSAKCLWNTQILATDLSARALSVAGAGVYSSEQIHPLPEKWKQNYFVRIDSEKSRVADRIKKEVVFRRLNLMDGAFPFKKKFHIIFCRNVMIYFDAADKKRLVNRFYELTQPGGYLFIGHSETIGRDESGYEYVSPSIYRRRG